ncbi:hypothetical protein K438DRAFT_2092350 [Mycena galopus ATCC 62051]|nr:hypothetical protein K438DRAFT_2092350 [Mycena galopus ATCC 62051]
MSDLRLHLRRWINQELIWANSEKRDAFRHGESKLPKKGSSQAQALFEERPKKIATIWLRKVVCRQEWSTRQEREEKALCAKGYIDDGAAHSNVGAERPEESVCVRGRAVSAARLSGDAESAGKAEAGRDGALMRSRPVRKGTRELEMRPKAAQQERSYQELEARARPKKRGAGPRAPNRSKRKGNKDSGGRWCESNVMDDGTQRGGRSRDPRRWSIAEDGTRRN